MLLFLFLSLFCMPIAEFVPKWNIAVSPTLTEQGKDRYGKETVESLDLQGIVKLNGTTVSKFLKVSGALIARNAFLEEVEGAGDLQFFDTKISQELRATGSLKACSTSFEKPILFSGQKGAFSNCKLKGIAIEREFGFKAAQVIELKEKTEVDGPIHFKGGGGKVHLYPGSRILGTVTGGEIVYKK